MSTLTSQVYRKRSAETTATNGLSPSMQKELAEWVETDPEPEQIKDPGFRQAYKRSKAQVLRQERTPPPEPPAPQPVPRPRRALPAKVAVPEPVEVPEPIQDPGPVSGRYAHGASMKATLEAVCMRPDLSSKAKFIAMVLASHFPTIRPSRERLMALTGLSLKGVARGLDELKREYLLEWKRGRAHQANKYTCLWL